ncbi:MAG: putative glycoside hydrolase, partial [Longimicrobiales bacterium]|nr:putative glycoside hydrolase [Longimicrobiales bacterium]
DFIALSKQELAEFGAPVTADVFGRVITTYDDSGIGQDWNQLVQVTDVLLPMVYPSLYWPGSLGVEDPDGDPYAIVRAALDTAVARMGRTQGAVATLRPWIQAFTLNGIPYGAEEMRAQIQAVEDAGLEEWLFWNPDAVYPEKAFR